MAKEIDWRKQFDQQRKAVRQALGEFHDPANSLDYSVELLAYEYRRLSAKLRELCAATEIFKKAKE